MEPRKNIALELQEAGVNLPAGLIVAPYAVPHGYFAAFADTVLARIRQQETAAELEELSPLLAGLSKKMPFAVPDGYFAEVPVPSLLDSIDRGMPYSVPSGYFDSLPETLLAKVAPQEAKVVRMRPRWIRMAAAAVVGGIIAVGGWIYETRVPASPGVRAEIAVQNGLKSVPDQALDEFIENTDPAASASLASNGNTHSEVKSMLNDVPVSEMDAFLEQVPLDDVPDIN
ncbi:MAG: hypothetical protein EOO15_02325 [Chitinophagaceae bacterium]|nr:MAG: hypothetical protein EOO15_02325 [Chitinophagaceae bacterium]